MVRWPVLLALLGCKGRPAHDDAPPAPRDARVVDAATWPELASFPPIQPVRVVALPVKTATPRFQLGGPVIAHGVAVVASSQFGFVAVDIHGGQIAWAKPAGEHVAPPLVLGDDILLIGECAGQVDVPATDRLLGCLRAVTPTGSDHAYFAIHARVANAAVEDFALAPGPDRLFATGPHTVLWIRSDRAVTVDTISGVATPAPATEPPLIVHDKARTWQVSQTEDGLIVAKGKPPWQTKHPYTTLLGAVYLPEQPPMVRISNIGAFAGHAELQLIDIDATGSMNGQVARPVPGIGLLGHAIDAVGDTALAVRLDPTLEHDFIAGYAANGLLMWVYPLPVQPRADPVGLAIAPDAVVVFHDGDTLTILPELSAPPTAPGAARVPSENTTP